MTHEPSPDVTFSDLDRGLGIPGSTRSPDQEYPLEAWYRAVREIPIRQLSVEDIARACRQAIHLEHVVPAALRTLDADPEAGEMYEGELIASLASVPSAYWSGHLAEASSLRSVIERARRVGIPNIERDLDELERKSRVGAR